MVKNLKMVKGTATLIINGMANNGMAITVTMVDGAGPSMAPTPTGTATLINGTATLITVIDGMVEGTATLIIGNGMAPTGSRARGHPGPEISTTGARVAARETRASVTSSTLCRTCRDTQGVTMSLGTHIVRRKAEVG